MARQQTTIADVATAAGVSTSTVSHAYTGKRPISDETRSRIFAAADRLSYRPSVRAQSLRTGRNNTIALVSTIPAELGTHSTHMQVFMDLAISGFPIAADHGYSMLIVPPIDDARSLENIDVDGAIVVNPVDDDPIVQLLESRGLPLVTIGRAYRGGEPLPGVDTGPPGALVALDHLRERGADQIGLVVAESETAVNRAIRRAYGLWCDEHRLPRHELALPELTQHPDAVRMISAQLASLESDGERYPVRAFYAPYDRFAAATVDAVGGRGDSVPEDVMVMTSNDGDIARSAQYALSALAPQSDRTSETAVLLMLSLLTGNDAQTTAPPLTTPTIIERRSTSPGH